MRPALRIVPGGSDELPSEPVMVPGRRDDLESVLALRDAVEARIVRERGDITLDCSAVETLASPELGWLCDVAQLLHRHGRALRLANARAELRFQVSAMTRTVGESPPGFRFVSSLTPHG